jgi:hypothetical protein
VTIQRLGRVADGGRRRGVRGLELEDARERRRGALRRAEAGEERGEMFHVKRG